MIIRLFQMFAIAPVALTATERIIVQLQSFASVLLIISLTIWAFISDNFPENNMRKLFAGVKFIVQTVTHLCIVIQSYGTRKKHLEIYGNFNAIDDTFALQIYCPPINYRIIRAKTFILSAILVISVLIKQMLMILFNDAYLPFYTRFIWYAELAIRIQFMQNIFYIDLLSEQLQRIHNAIQRIFTSRRTDLFVFIIEQQRHNGGSVCDANYVELLALKKLYAQIWCTSRLINDCLGWSLLATITESFILLTTHGYWIFKNMPGCSMLFIDITVVLFMILMLCGLCNKCTQSVCLYTDIFLFFFFIYF